MLRAVIAAVGVWFLINHVNFKDVNTYAEKAKDLIKPTSSVMSRFIPAIPPLPAVKAEPKTEVRLAGSYGMGQDYQASSDSNDNNFCKTYVDYCRREGHKEVKND